MEMMMDPCAGWTSDEYFAAACKAMEEDRPDLADKMALLGLGALADEEWAARNAGESVPDFKAQAQSHRVRRCAGMSNLRVAVAV